MAVVTCTSWPAFDHHFDFIDAATAGPRPSVCLGYDGDKVWALPRALRALTWRHNLIDLTRRSTTYEARLERVFFFLSFFLPV